MKVPYSVPYDATTLIYHIHPGQNGPSVNFFCHEIDMVIPTLTNDVDTILTIVGADGTTRYTSAAQARTTKTAYFPTGGLWIDTSDTIILTVDGVVGGAHIVYVTLIGGRRLR